MTVCPLLIVCVFMCYRIFFYVITFSDLKLTHNGMSYVHLSVYKSNISCLPYEWAGFLFVYDMKWNSVTFVHVHACTCIKGGSECSSSSSNVNINTIIKSEWQACTTAHLPKLTYLMVYNAKVQGCEYTAHQFQNLWMSKWVWNSHGVKRIM